MNLFRRGEGSCLRVARRILDADDGLTVYNVALNSDDKRSILVAGMQLGSWTRDYPDRARMPVVA